MIIKFLILLFLFINFNNHCLSLENTETIENVYSSGSENYNACGSLPNTTGSYGLDSVTIVATRCSQTSYYGPVSDNSEGCFVEATQKLIRGQPFALLTYEYNTVFVYNGTDVCVVFYSDYFSCYGSSWYNQPPTIYQNKECYMTCISTNSEKAYNTTWTVTLMDSYNSNCYGSNKCYIDKVEFTISNSNKILPFFGLILILFLICFII